MKSLKELIGKKKLMELFNYPQWGGIIFCGINLLFWDGIFEFMWSHFRGNDFVFYAYLIGGSVTSMIIWALLVKDYGQSKRRKT